MSYTLNEKKRTLRIMFMRVGMIIYKYYIYINVYVYMYDEFKKDKKEFFVFKNYG